MHVLVTGSSGFIGTQLVEALQHSHSVTGYDLADGDDILDVERLQEAMQGCDVVVHLAAYSAPFEDTDFTEYFRVNCRGTLNVAKAAEATGVERIVYASSTSYYGAERGIPLPLPLEEDGPLLTQHADVDSLECRDCDIAHSTSKVIAEQVLANYGLNKKVEVVILRLGPTRAEGEYRPFGEADLHLKMENAVQALQNAMEHAGPLWYEAFTITDENEHVDLEKAKDVLGYKPT